MLIDRGVESDRSFPSGRAYLLNTPDKARNVRAVYFEKTAKKLKGVFPVEVLKANAISNRSDVLFYFTGLLQVPQLETLHFLPGALADHLTSLGGQLTDSTQMSSLRWLEAGATASYGTVVEPCNFSQKFPFPALRCFSTPQAQAQSKPTGKVWRGRLRGCLWVSRWRALSPKLQEIAPDQFELKIFTPHAGQLGVESAKSSAGPYSPVALQTLKRGLNVIRFGTAEIPDGFLRLQW